MKNYHLCIGFYLLCWSSTLTAQELTPFVVSSSGGFYSNAAGMLSFTTGEMTAVETFTSPVWTLTQGFQQPWDFGTSVDDPHASFAFGVYPNPSNGQFQLVTETEESVALDIRITTLLGQDILHTGLHQDVILNVHPFDISHVAPGMYLMTIAMQEGAQGKVHQFVTKLQVVR